jgi:hypothetical protein
MTAGPGISQTSAMWPGRLVTSTASSSAFTRFPLRALMKFGDPGDPSRHSQPAQQPVNPLVRWCFRARAWAI